jgi:DNA primase
LVAYSLRDTRDNVNYDDKYMLTYNFNKDGVIYNLNNVKKIANEKPLIVVEGFKSVWRFKEYGISNVVAVMGSCITSGQISLLCSYALNGIVIMFDNDLAGVVGALKSYEAVRNKFPTDIVFITEVDEDGNGLDPADLTKKQVYSYIKKYI